MSRTTSRRTFLKHAAYAGAALPAVMPALVRAASPNEKVNLGAIGVGGKGWSDVNLTSKEHAVVVALCDVDARNLAKAKETFTDAADYADWRVMLDREHHRLDGVTVSTPDHMHAPATMAALHLGIATYTQKPLTRTVHEARQLTLAAEKAGVATQMGNQGHNGIAYRMVVELIRSGAIGKVTEAHTWSDRPYWPQGQAVPEGSDPVPDHLSWNLWLGVAEHRPYRDKYASGPFEGKDVYHPFVWRGWYDFGSGSLGDMGCHILDPVVWSMELGAPKTIAYEGPEPMPDAFPSEETLTYVFPGTKHTAADTITVKWYDGGRMPPRELVPMPPERNLPTNGSLYIGTEGVLLAPHGGSGPRLYPEDRYEGYEYPRLEGRDHYMQWTNAIRGADKTTSHFGYAGPLTEAVQLGVIASRIGNEMLQWDAANLRFTNSQKANRYVQQPYREGWEVTGLV